MQAPWAKPPVRHAEGQLAAPDLPQAYLVADQARVGRESPRNLTSPTPTARPLPGEPDQPSHSRRSATWRRGRGIPASPDRRRSGSRRTRGRAESSSATTWPFPNTPPSRLISVIRSIISVGGAGSAHCRTEIAAPAGLSGSFGCSGFRGVEVVRVGQAVSLVARRREVARRCMSPAGLSRAAARRPPFRSRRSPAQGGLSAW